MGMGMGVGVGVGVASAVPPLPFEKEGGDEAREGKAQAGAGLRDTVSSWELQGSCEWRRTGEGEGYQLLAGPAFVILSTVCGIPLGEYAGKRPRVAAVAIMAAMWSASGAAGGLWSVVGS
jgi:hypothetical protein